MSGSARKGAGSSDTLRARVLRTRRLRRRDRAMQALWGLLIRLDTRRSCISQGQLARIVFSKITTMRPPNAQFISWFRSVARTSTLFRGKTSCSPSREIFVEGKLWSLRTISLLHSAGIDVCSCMALAADRSAAEAPQDAFALRQGFAHHDPVARMRQGGVGLLRVEIDALLSSGFQSPCGAAINTVSGISSPRNR